MLKLTLVAFAVAASTTSIKTETSVKVEAIVRYCSVLDADGCLLPTVPDLALHTATGTSIPCNVRHLDSPIRLVLVRDRSFSLTGARDRAIRQAFS